MITLIEKADYTEMLFQAKRGISVLRFFGLRPQNDSNTIICVIVF